MGRKSGCLTVTDLSNFGYVYFEQGRVIFATVLNRPDRLGDVLLKNGVITANQLAEAVKEQERHSERRLGQILISQAGLTQEHLQTFVGVQIEEAVYHLFGWESGSFHFEPDQRPDAHEALLVSLNTEGLLLEGARRVDEWALIEKKIQSTELIFSVEKTSGEGDEDIELTSEQEAVLPLLDGERSVDDVVIESGLVEFDVAKAIFGLIQAGFVGSEGRRSEEAAPEEPEASRHLELAGAFYRAGMLEEAESEYGAALEIDPEVPLALRRLALIALRTGRPGEALEQLDTLSESVEEGTGDLRNRAVAFERLGRYDEGLASLEQAAEVNPQDKRVMLARAVLLLKGGQPDEAVEVFRRYGQSEKEGAAGSPMYFAYALLAAASIGDLDDAIGIGREGLKTFPASAPILVNLGAVLERKGEDDAAEALYLRAVQQAVPPPQAHKNLGDLSYRRGNKAEARTHYERAVKLDPALGDDTYARLGEFAHKDGKPKVARMLWERAVKLNPENDAVRKKLTRLSKAKGS